MSQGGRGSLGAGSAGGSPGQWGSWLQPGAGVHPEPNGGESQGSNSQAVNQ